MQNACQAFLLDRRNFIPFFCSHFPKRTRIEGCIRAKFCHRERRAFLHVIPNQAKGFTRHPEVLHVIPNECEGSPRLLQPVPCEGIPRFADFAPMGLVRRFVEMLLQAGISPRVGRNDTLRWSFEQATNHAASKTTLLRSLVRFDNPSASLRSAPSLAQGGQDRRYRSCRKERRAVPQRDSICAYLRLRGKVNARAL